MRKTRKLILIVDDSKDLREIYAKFLTHHGFRVALAGDGEEALVLAFKLQPDLILMDLGLPVLGGRAAARRLKEHEKTEHIPIVILTATEGGPEAVIKEGCEGFLTKPSLPEDMLKEVARVLAGAAAKRQP